MYVRTVFVFGAVSVPPVAAVRPRQLFGKGCEEIEDTQRKDDVVVDGDENIDSEHTVSET